MSRRTEREAVFKLIFRREFNSEEEMKDQLAYFFGDNEESGKLSEEEQKKVEDRYELAASHMEKAPMVERTVNHTTFTTGCSSKLSAMNRTPDPNIHACWITFLRRVTRMDCSSSLIHLRMLDLKRSSSMGVVERTSRFMPSIRPSI